MRRRCFTPEHAGGSCSRPPAPAGLTGIIVKLTITARAWSAGSTRVCRPARCPEIVELLDRRLLTPDAPEPRSRWWPTRLARAASQPGRPGARPASPPPLWPTHSCIERHACRLACAAARACSTRSARGPGRAGWARCKVERSAGWVADHRPAQVPEQRMSPGRLGACPRAARRTASGGIKLRRGLSKPYGADHRCDPPARQG